MVQSKCMKCQLYNLMKAYIAAGSTSTGASRGGGWLKPPNKTTGRSIYISAMSHDACTK